MAEHGFHAWFRLYGGLACAIAVMVCGAADHRPRRSPSAAGDSRRGCGPLGARLRAHNGCLRTRGDRRRRAGPPRVRLEPRADRDPRDSARCHRRAAPNEQLPHHCVRSDLARSLACAGAAPVASRRAPHSRLEAPAADPNRSGNRGLGPRPLCRAACGQADSATGRYPGIVGPGRHEHRAAICASRGHQRRTGDDQVPAHNLNERWTGGVSPLRAGSWPAPGGGPCAGLAVPMPPSSFCTGVRSGFRTAES